MAKIAITGSQGFIASALWEKLKDKHTLKGMDKLTYAAKQDYRLTNSSILIGDCSNPMEVEWFFEDHGTFDKVIIAHAESHVDNSVKNPSAFFKSNALGTQIMLEACRQRNIPQIYVIVTDEVLKHQAYDPEDGFFNYPEVDLMENTSYHASSPYAASKLCQEVIARSYRTTYGMNITLIRPTNVYGPGQFPEKFISKAVLDTLNGRPITLYEGAENYYRDYTYIHDTVRALELILEVEDPLPLYHIAANDERSNGDVIKAVTELLPEAKVKIVEDPRKTCHDPCYSLRAQRVRDLGWKPRMPFKSGLLSTIEHFMENNSG